MAGIRLCDYVARIEDLVRADHRDEAIVHCRHILHRYPKYFRIYRVLGKACLAKGMYPEARDLFQRMLSADPEDLATWIGLGAAYDVEGMLPEAIWATERAFELEPHRKEVRQELQRLYRGRDGARDDGTHLDGGRLRLKLTRGALGRLYIRNGLYEQAIEEFQAVLRRDAGLPDIRVALAEVLWRQRRYLEATDACLEILETLPDCLKANLVLGTVWLSRGNPRVAEAKLKAARALDPENLIAQEVMGEKSPLASEEVLVPVLEMGGYRPLPMEATPGEQSAAESIPVWVRELELLDAQVTDI